MGLVGASLSVLIVAGLANVGARLARRFLRREPDADERAAGYVLAVAAAGATAHGLALAHHASAVILRIIAWGLGAAGALHLPALASSASSLRTSTRACVPRLDRIDRVALMLCGVLLFAFGLAALGPPTDADSLTFHLAVPMDWLRVHGAYARPEWPYARFAGLGEALVMIGLAGGTDTLGACLQFTGLIVAARAVSAFASGRHDAIAGALLVLGAPAMLFLVSTQKFQLLPAAATTLALVLVLKHFEELDAGRLALAFGAVAFAVGSKYSFLFSGAVVFVVGLWAARRSGRLPAALAIGSFAFAIIAAPVYLRNWSFYGDPLSPFLERFRLHPDPVIVAFAEAQRQPGAGTDAVASLMLLPAGLIIPLQIGAVSQPLGVGVLFVFAVTLSRGVARRLVAAAGAVTALGLLLGQLSPRFFLEPYWWCGAAAVASVSRLRNLDTLLVAQAAAVAAAAVILAATLTPALFNERLRDRVMTRMAAGYAESRWIDAIVPRDAVLLASTRSYALLPRTFVPAELLTEGDIEHEAEVRAFVAAHGVSAIAFDFKDSPPMADFVARCGRRLGERAFTRAARNPWNRRDRYVVVAATVDWTRDGCGR